MATLCVLEYQKRSTFDYYHHGVRNFNGTHLTFHSGTVLDPRVVASPPYNPPQLLPGGQHFSHENSYPFIPTISHPSSSSSSSVTATPTKSLKFPSKHSQLYEKSVHDHVPSLLATSKAAVLGRPSHCPAYLTLAPCKVYCCHSSNDGGDDGIFALKHIDMKNLVVSSATSGGPSGSKVVVSGSSLSKISSNSNNKINGTGPDDVVAASASSVCQ